MLVDHSPYPENDRIYFLSQLFLARDRFAKTLRCALGQLINPHGGQQNQLFHSSLALAALLNRLISVVKATNLVTVPTPSSCLTFRLEYNYNAVFPRVCHSRYIARVRSP